MREMLETSAFLGVVITLGSFELGRAMKKRWNFALFNPLLLGIVFSVAVLLVFRIDYGTYLNGAKYVNFLLTPATVCLAVPLYEKFELLKKNALAVMLGIGAGVVASAATVFALSALFRLDLSMFATLLPKSITTAIGMDVSVELGGYASLTVAAIIMTGVLGNICAESACRLFRITSPIAQGVAIGTASHAVGTSKALEMGEIQGAMSSLSLVVAGLLTVVFAAPVASLYEFLIRV